MTTEQTKALELADELQQVHDGHADEGPSSFSQAAAELRRLAAIEAERDALRAALQNYVATIANAGGGDKALFMAGIREADNAAREVLNTLPAQKDRT